jgi:hypothetical protein
VTHFSDLRKVTEIRATYGGAMSRFSLLVLVSSVASFLAAGGYTLVPRVLFDPACTIKGNVSTDSGERIFHTPEQEYYSATTVRLDRGERWFCSEEEAYQAGWRKARR